MIYPTIHMNGTSAESLLEDVVKALMAVRAAQNALAQATPHARDYYVQKDYPQSYQQARDEHQDRMKRIQSVRIELEQLAEGIANRKGNA